MSDAWQITTKSQALDWSLILCTASSAGLMLPLAAMLGYLADRLEAPIPEEFLRALESAAAD